MGKIPLIVYLMYVFSNLFYFNQLCSLIVALQFVPRTSFICAHDIRSTQHPYLLITVQLSILDEGRSYFCEVLYCFTATQMDCSLNGMFLLFWSLPLSMFQCVCAMFACDRQVLSNVDAIFNKCNK